MLFDHIYKGICEAPVSPLEYIDAFNRTRHILMKSKNTILYFIALNDFFASGNSYNELDAYITDFIDN
jgi:hypothetical protein